MTRSNTIRALAFTILATLAPPVTFPQQARADDAPHAPLRAGTPRLGFLHARGNLSGAIHSQFPGHQQYRETFFEVHHGPRPSTRPATPSGYNPSPYPGMAVHRQADIFATSLGGGTATGSGTLFKLKNGASRLTPLADFIPDTGVPSRGLVTDRLGNVYGTTSNTVFEYNKRTGAVTTLATIHAGNTNSLAIDHAGTLYGLTDGAGTGSPGVLFELKKGSTGVTTLLDLGSTGTPPLSILKVDRTGHVFALGADGTSVVELKNGSHGLTTVTPPGSFPDVVVPTNIAASKSPHSADVDYGVAPVSTPGVGMGVVIEVGSNRPAVPELDPGALGGSLTLLLGGLLVILDRRARGQSLRTA